MKYDKLVRDNIPEIIRQNGSEPRTHIADEKEYWVKLKEKLGEEVQEFLKDETMDEIADILEVVDAIIEYKHFSPADIEHIKDKKAKGCGKFSKRIILEEA